MEKKFAIALGGGAARGAFHLGVLHFMEENNIQIDAYSGSSIGAIISVSHASGVKAKEQLKIFSSRELKSVLKFNYFKNGLLKIQKDHKILNDLLPISKLEDLPKKNYITAYDLKRRELHYFDKGDSHILCMASSALIPLFKPISYENMYLIDGGLFDCLPIKVFDKNEYEVFAIDLFPKSNKKLKKLRLNPIKYFKRRLFTQLYENHSLSILHANTYLGSYEIRDYSMFTFKELHDCFDFGYKEAKKIFLSNKTTLKL